MFGQSTWANGSLRILFQGFVLEEEISTFEVQVHAHRCSVATSPRLRRYHHLYRTRPNRHPLTTADAATALGSYQSGAPSMSFAPITTQSLAAWP